MSTSPLSEVISFRQIDRLFDPAFVVDDASNAPASGTGGITLPGILGLSIWLRNVLDSFPFISLDRGLYVVLIWLSLQVSVALCKRRMSLEKVSEDTSRNTRFSIGAFMMQVGLDFTVETVLFGVVLAATLAPFLFLTWFIADLWPLHTTSWDYRLINEFGIICKTIHWYWSLSREEGSILGYLQ